MATLSSNQLRVGVKLLIDADPHIVLAADFVKPGKGQAFSRIKVRNLVNGRVTERTYKSSDTAEAADVVDTSMQFLYSDGETWNFMNPESFEQVAANKNAMGDTPQWIRAEDFCTVTLWDGNPIAVAPPIFVELKITETDPGMRGDTSGGGTKPATLETGAVVKVPLFIQTGEKIKCDTRTGEYVNRAK